MKVVLDTSVVSAAMRRDALTMAWMRGVAPRTLVLSAPVHAEIQYGLAHLEPGSRRWKALHAAYDELRSLIGWLDWTEEAASVFGTTKAHLERAGTPVADLDVVIASIALANRAAVATFNVRDFARVPNLKVLTPSSAQEP